MGREVRKVPADWQHPVAFNHYQNKDCLVPLYDSAQRSFVTEASEWDEGWQKWQEGLCRAYGDGPLWEPIEEKYSRMRYTDYAGARPSPDDYMPDWPAETRTHFMMYENTSEGTPISPAFATPEELAQWLVDNNASSFAGHTASYEAWLKIARGGWAPSMVMSGAGIQSGVEFLATGGNE